jgi:hypothetical protein
MACRLLRPAKLESFAVVCYVPEHRLEGGSAMMRFLEVRGV